MLNILRMSSVGDTVGLYSARLLVSYLVLESSKPLTPPPHASVSSSTTSLILPHLSSGDSTRILMLDIIVRII